MTPAPPRSHSPRPLLHRLLLCSALPETLDPASYATLLPCGGGDNDKLFAVASTAKAAAAAAAADQGHKTKAPLPRASRAGGAEPATATATATAAAAVERQQDPRVLAAWYAGRARELDARAGQLKHAATMSQLGVSRVLTAGGHGGAGAEAGAEAGAGAGADAAVEELLQLDLLLQHLASLVREEQRACCSSTVRRLLGVVVVALAEWQVAWRLVVCS